MSTFVCPSCQRSFAEAGFCPYDGSALGSAVHPSDAAPLITARELSVHTSKTAVRTLTMPQFSSTIDTAPPGPPSHAAGTPTSRPSSTPMSAPSSAPMSTPPGAAAGTPSGAPPATGAGGGAAALMRADLPTHRDPVLAAAAPASAKPPVVRAISAAEETESAVSSLGRRGTVYDQIVGQTLDGRYFIERKIGEGGMGVVYAARHAVIERPLAIKVLKKEALRDAATITRFVQEAKAASRIGHPNIVDVTDFGTTPEGLTYSVMEYVKGTTLSMVIKTAAPLPVMRSAGIAQQLARALGAAHDKGIVHRDLKPENIFLVDRDGRPDFVKIVDFGIAKVTPIDGTAAGPRLTRAGSVFGTPEYMAPEQAAGRSDIDGRVDIYALGVILYEMVTGRLPLKGDTAVRTIAMQLLDPIIPPRQLRPDLDISAECEAIIMKALAKRRDERYRTMAELQAALEQLLRSRPARSAAQPVAGLAPLPPGADPRLMMDSVMVEVTTGTSAPTTSLGPEATRGLMQRSDELRARRGSEGPPVAAVPGSAPPGAVPPRPHRPSDVPLPVGHLAVRHEPEFVKTGVSSFDHVFLDAPPPPRSRRMVFVVGALVVAVAAGATVAVLVQRKSPGATTGAQTGGVAALGGQADASPESPGSGGSGDSQSTGGTAGTPITEGTPSSPEQRDPPGTGAGGTAPRDAGAAQDGASRTAGGDRTTSRRKDARGSEAPSRDVTVQIITYPDEGTVYRGRTYRGPGGTTVQEPFGTVARFTCTKVGYKEGFVDVKFDDKTPIAVCVMTRKKVCVDDLKNPYDNCLDAGPKAR